MWPNLRVEDGRLGAKISGSRWRSNSACLTIDLFYGFCIAATSGNNRCIGLIKSNEPCMMTHPANFGMFIFWRQDSQVQHEYSQSMIALFYVAPFFPTIFWDELYISQLVKPSHCWCTCAMLRHDLKMGNAAVTIISSPQCSPSTMGRRT